MSGIEQLQSRLANVRTVEPILGALRTISLGSWQAAQNQRTGLQRFAYHLQEVLRQVAPALPQPSPRRLWSRAKPVPAVVPDNPERVVLLVLGTERGLCGRFNDAIVERALDYMEARAAEEVSVTLAVLGSRAGRLFKRAGQPFSVAGALSTTALPSFALAFALMQGWLAEYEAATLDAVDLVYNAYAGVGRYTTTVQRLLPPEAPSVDADVPEAVGYRPPTIVETDPVRLYARVVEQWAALSFYGLLLDGAAAEHATRYQLMEAASQNAERLIEELTLEMQSLRRQAITREMQELAVGAGLMSPRD